MRGLPIGEGHTASAKRPGTLILCGWVWPTHRTILVMSQSVWQFSGDPTMARCNRTTYLEVHHVDRGGGNVIQNARVLCPACLARSQGEEDSEDSATEFSTETIAMAILNAHHQCECTRFDGCH